MVHFYAGNDGPDTYRRGRSRWQALIGHSRLWTFTRNTLRLRRSVEPNLRASGDKALGIPNGTAGPGGTIVDPNRRLPEDDPLLVGPTFEPEAFDGILADELRRLYSPPDPVSLDRAWQPVIEDLDAIREHVTRGGGRLALVVYPSALQVDSTMREQLVARLRARDRYRRLTLGAIDPALPQKRLAAYCNRVGISCFDVTSALILAHRAEPGAPLYKLRDTHWTIRGNRVAARAETEQLVGLVCPHTSRLDSIAPRTASASPPGPTRDPEDDAGRISSE